jgi:hypothetical protein
MSIKKLIAEMVQDTLSEMKTPYVVIDTADGNKVVAMASDERGAKSSISSAERPPMYIKDKNTLKIVKSSKKQSIGYPLSEEVELDEATYEDMLKDVNRLSGGDFTLKYQMSKAAFKRADPNRKDSKAKRRGVGLGHMKKESIELDEATDPHNDLNDVIFDFQKKIMRFGRANLDEKIAKNLKAIDNDLDNLRSDLFKVRKGR